MASGSDIRAGGAFIDLYVRDRVRAGLKRASASLKRFQARVGAVGKSLAMAGAIGAVAFGAAVAHFVKVGDELDKMSKRTGMSAEALSRLGFAAERSGADLATVEKGLRTLQRSILDAERGSKEIVDTFDDLGISFQDLEGLSPEEQFKAVGLAIARIEDPSKRAALSLKLLGRSGTQLLPMFAEGADGIAALEAEADRLGRTLTGEQAASAAALADAWTDVKSAVGGVVLRLGGALAPILTKIATLFADVVVKVSNFIQANQGIVKIVAGVMVGLLAAGAALMVLAGIAGAAAIGIAVIGTIAGAIGTALSAMGAVIAAMISPVGLAVAACALLVAAFIGLGVAFFRLTETGRGAVAGLVKIFRDLWGRIAPSLKAIGQAIRAGEIKMAVKILGLAIKAEFQRVIVWLYTNFSTFMVYFTLIWNTAKTVVVTAWATITSFISQAWNATVGFLVKAWEAAIGTVADGMSSVSGWWTTATGGMIDDWESFIAFMLQSFNAAAGELHKQFFKLGAGLANLLNKISFGQLGMEISDRTVSAVINSIDADTEGRSRRIREGADAARETREGLAEQGQADAQANLDETQAELDELRRQADALNVEGEDIASDPMSAPDLPGVSGPESKTAVGGAFRSAQVQALSFQSQASSDVKKQIDELTQIKEVLQDIHREGGGGPVFA
jgi:hypothetical protein